MTESAICSACSIPIREKMSGRRSLDGSAAGMDVVRTVLTDMLLEGVRGSLLYDVQRYILREGAYICKKCFSSAKRLYDEKQKLQSTISSAFQAFLTEHGSLGCKRSAEVEFESEDGNAPKRPRPDDIQQQSVRRKLPFTQPPLGSASPTVTVVVGHDTRPRYFHLTQSLKKLGRYVGRGRRSSIASAALGNARLRSELLRLVCQDVRNEVRKLCSQGHDSILKLRSKPALERFTWKTVWQELEQVAPTLMCLLCGFVSPSKSSLDSVQPALCMCASIILKLQNKCVNLIQSIVSLVLKAGHATKEVFTRLQSIMICLSHQSTIGMMEDACDGHDEEVLEWQDTLMPRLTIPLEAMPSAPVHHSSMPPALSIDAATCADTSALSNMSLGNMVEPCSLTTSLQHTSLTDLSGISTSFISEPMSPTPPPFSPVTLSSSPMSSGRESPTLVGSTPLMPRSSPIDHTAVMCSTPQDSFAITQPLWQGFKVIGDNLDRNVKPRYQRCSRQTQSLHFFNAYAVMDRCNLAAFSDEVVRVEPSTLDISVFLPSPSDLKEITKNFAVLVGRVIHEHMPAFSKIPNLSIKHIKLERYEEMSQKSKVVPLGVVMKNENKLDEMVDILDYMHQYVPTKTCDTTVSCPGEDTAEHLRVDHMHRILFGGDQLTAARIRGAQRMRAGSTHGSGRLEGVVPVVEDWHAKVCLLEVIWIRLYDKGTCRDAGTLKQLQSLINRSNVPKKVKNNVNAAEDFIEVVFESLAISAVQQHLGMTLTDEDSDPAVTKTLLECGSQEERRKHFHSIIAGTLEKLVNLPLITEATNSEDAIVEDSQAQLRSEGSRQAPCADGVHSRAEGVNSRHPDVVKSVTIKDDTFLYMQELLTLSLVYVEFTDAIREGDGPRVLRVWKFLLLIFKASRRKNYSVEAMTLLAQYHYLLSPREKEQLLWSRFVNTGGRQGGNQPADLHMEHLNRVVKGSIGRQSSNLTPKNITRIGKCAGPLMSIAKQFDMELHIRQQSGRHKKVSNDSDRKKLLDQLNSIHAFQVIPGRVYTNQHGIKGSIISKLDHKNVLAWVRYHANALISS